jgi:hypothetical protein
LEAAAQARRVIEAHAAVGPFLIFGENVFRDERQAGGAADQLEVERVGLGRNQREDGLSVGRSHRNEAFAGLQFGIVSKVEAELVNIETHAAVLIAHVDVDRVDAQVGRRLWGWCGGGHGKDYKMRRGNDRTKEKSKRRGACAGERLLEAAKWGTI